MKLQYHKIANVDKNVCTCEQKIAYNFAFQCYINYNFVNEYKAQIVELYRQEIVSEFIAKCMKNLKNSYEYEKIAKNYNIDAIQAALNAGAENYINTKYHVLSSYEEIGKIFPANYL